MAEISLRTLIATFIVIAASIGIALLEPVQIQGLKAMDWERRTLVPRRGASQDVVLVSVDQQSLDLMQSQGFGWPWPRELYGAIGQYVTSGGARSVLFDILYNHETPCGGDTDAQFAELLRVTPNAYLSGATFAEGGVKGEQWGFTFSGEAPEESYRSGLSTPLPLLLEGAQGFGIVSAVPDSDGTFRRMLPLHTVDDKAFPMLALAPFVDRNSSLEWRDSSVDVNGRTLPIDSEGQVWLNYRGKGNGSFKSYSAYEVVQSYIAQLRGDPVAVSASEFKNKHVVVGYAAPGLYDLSPTPFSSYAPGMQIHATALDNWLHDDWLVPVPMWLAIVMGVAFAVGGFLAFYMQLRIRTSLLLAMVVILLGLYLQIQLLKFGYVVNLTVLLLPVITVVIWTTMLNLVRENRERLFRQLSLERVVSPKVAEWMMADKARMERFGEQRNITVFFSDLEGFTQLSESLGCGSMVSLLNEYLDFMHHAVLKEEGIINKFIGDAVMAFWGAPLNQKDQAVRAIRVAMATVDGLRDFQPSDKELSGLRLNMRVGIDYGECVVGNIGAGERFEYTAIGNTVNQASRLEGLNKYYGTDILVGEAAWLETDRQIFGRCLDYVRVKGRNEPVRLYEPMAENGAQTPAQEWIRVTYEKAWAHYAKREWEEAETLFKMLVDEERDKPAVMMLARIAQIKADNFLPDDWNGIYRFDKK